MFRIMAAATLLAAGAQAATPPPGVVMQVDAKELFVNLGAQDGLTPGATLRLYRRVVIEHPITKKPVEDRFPIGVVQVAEAGRLLSIVRSFDGLSRPPAPGDFVEVGALPRHTPEARSVATAPNEPTDVTALHAVLRENMGQPPEIQASNLKAWVTAFSKSQHAAAVARAIATLEVQAQAPETLPEPIDPAQQPLSSRHQRVPTVEAGRPLALAVAIVEVDQVQAVRLLVRRAGPGTWHTIQMHRAGDHYWRITMPATLIGEAGTVQYALEAVRVDGRTEALYADLMKPSVLKVLPQPPGEGPHGASHAEVTLRYVDFNLSGEGDDRYLQTETRFRYIVDFKRLRSVEVGVGLIDGKGGTVDDLAAGRASEALTLGYAFAAAEISMGDFVGLGARMTGGNHRSTPEATARSVIGLQGHLRLGRDTATHMVMGVAALDDLGSRYFADFHIRSFHRLPVTAKAEATNLPVDADYGLRLGGDVGWQALDWLTLKVEAGWNARTINHYGFTSGLGLAMDWE